MKHRIIIGGLLLLKASMISAADKLPVTIQHYSLLFCDVDEPDISYTHKLGSDTFNRGGLHSWFFSNIDSKHIAVAKDKLSIPVGFVYYTFNKHDAYIDYLAVEEKLRFKGIGKALVQGVIKQSKNNGMQSLKLESPLNNYQVYQAMGFEITRQSEDSIVCKIDIKARPSCNIL